MNKAYYYKQLCGIANDYDIKIERINDPTLKNGCAIITDFDNTYIVVLNLFRLKNVAMKLRALKWAVECCIDESKTEWRYFNVIPTGNTNRP